MITQRTNLGQGRVIRCHLTNGTLDGPQVIDVLNWSGRALRFPRKTLDEALATWESPSLGVYLLFGSPSQTGEVEVYVGEAEDLARRLRDHSSKEFWKSAVAFVCTSGNLSKAHARCLEALLIQGLKQEPNVNLKNTTLPSTPTLSSAERCFVDQFLEHIWLVLQHGGLLQPAASLSAAHAEESPVFHHVSRGLEARLVVRDDQFVVLAGSLAARETKESCSSASKSKRRELQDQGLLLAEDKFLSFKEDVSFSSASTAGGVVTGTSSEGPKIWKTQAGRITLADFLKSRK